MSDKKNKKIKVLKMYSSIDLFSGSLIFTGVMGVLEQIPADIFCRSHVDEQKCTLRLRPMDNLECSSNLSCMFGGECGSKLEYPEKNNVNQTLHLNGSSK